MKEALEDLLSEYQEKYDKNEAECIDLMKVGLPWHEHAKQGAGLKMMIDHCKSEIDKIKRKEEQK
jgi:site-specific recombinase